MKMTGEVERNNILLSKRQKKTKKGEEKKCQKQ